MRSEAGFPVTSMSRRQPHPSMINYRNQLKRLLLASAAVLGCAFSARAQNSNAVQPRIVSTPVAANQGLLGSGYVGIGGHYVHLGAGTADAERGFTLYYNQPLKPGYDLTLDYDWARAQSAGFRDTDQKAGAVLTAYNTEDWGRPFFAVGADWTWRYRTPLGNHSSLGLLAGTGFEIQMAPAVVLTPFVNFSRQTGFSQNEFDFGFKGTYRFAREWSVTALAQYNNVSHQGDGAKFALGLNYHF